MAFTSPEDKKKKLEKKPAEREAPAKAPAGPHREAPAPGGPRHQQVGLRPGCPSQDPRLILWRP